MTSPVPDPEAHEALPQVHLADDNGRAACTGEPFSLPEDAPKVALCERCRLIARDWDSEEEARLRYDIERGMA